MDICNLKNFNFCAQRILNDWEKNKGKFNKLFAFF
jgi:hypothetical protein